ncbi:MAG: zinc-ribbon domain-containing protein [Clostridia bacterium]|nr:zinc-ribbon domain-containing protein [Clostridia bacterium]
MAFFEKLGKQANSLVETTRVNSSINTEKNNIKKLYAEIGEKVYNVYDKEGKVENDLMEFCELIKQSNEKIAELQEKLLEISGKKLCVKCEKEIEREVVFCPHCGEKQE